MRKIWGPVQSDNTWKIRSNEELYQIMNQPSILQKQKSRRLQWAGHVIRMPNNRFPLKAFNTRLTSKRPIGRPRTRWKDAVEQDLNALNIQNWQEAAADRGLWRRIVGAARGLQGL